MEIGRAYRVPIVIEPYPEGGFGVRSPLFPELISEGDTFEEALAHANDALQAVLELYEDLGKDLPRGVLIGTLRDAVKQLGISWDDFVRA